MFVNCTLFANEMNLAGNLFVLMKKKEMNVILAAQMRLKRAEILAATDGLSEGLVEVSLPKFLSYLSKICLAWRW